MSKMKVGHDVEEGFSLRDALQEGYFSDLVVTSTDGQPFNVHRTILACCSPQMTCREWEVFLQTLKAQHLSAVLKLVTLKNVKEESSESIYDSRNFFLVSFISCSFLQLHLLWLSSLRCHGVSGEGTRVSCVDQPQADSPRQRLQGVHWKL